MTEREQAIALAKQMGILYFTSPTTTDSLCGSGAFAPSLGGLSALGFGLADYLGERAVKGFARLVRLDLAPDLDETAAALGIGQLVCLGWHGGDCSTCGGGP